MIYKKIMAFKNNIHPDINMLVKYYKYYVQ